MSHRWVPGVLEGRRSSSTFQCPNSCLADEEDMGVRVGSEAGGKKEEGSRILLCSVSFFGLTHTHLQFKKKENRDLFGLPLLSLHTPALSHRSSKLSNLHWSGKKGEVFSTLSHKLGRSSGDGSFKERTWSVTSIIRLSPTNSPGASSRPCSHWKRWPGTGSASSYWLQVSGDSEPSSGSGFCWCSRD